VFDVHISQDAGRGDAGSNRRSMSGPWGRKSKEGVGGVFI